MWHAAPNLRWLSVLVLVVVSAAPGCTRGAEESRSPEVTAAVPSPAPFPTASPSATLPAVPASALQADALAPEVRACVREPDLGFDVDFYEIGRASDGPDDYVYLEWFDQLTPAAAFDSHPALLRFRDGVCETLLQPGFEAEDADLRALLPAAVADEIEGETLAWKVEVAGGRDAYVARAREIDDRSGHQWRECASVSTDRTCVSATSAALMRGLGFEVRAPSTPAR